MGGGRHSWSRCRTPLRSSIDRLRPACDPCSDAAAQSAGSYQPLRAARLARVNCGQPDPARTHALPVPADDGRGQAAVADPRTDADPSPALAGGKRRDKGLLGRWVSAVTAPSPIPAMLTGTVQGRAVRLVGTAMCGAGSVMRADLAGSLVMLGLVLLTGGIAGSSPRDIP